MKVVMWQRRQILILFIINSADVILSAILTNNAGTEACRRRRLCEFNYRWDRTQRNNVVDASCYCTADCSTYGDCCIDSPNNSSQPNTDYTCTKEALSDSFFIKIKCPYDSDAELRRLCENPNVNDPFLYIPATSSFTNITYRNIFCAICSQEDIRSLKLWLPVLSCFAYDGSNYFLDVSSLRSHVKYNLRTGMWEYRPVDVYMREFRNGVRCQTEFSIPPHLLFNNIKRCKDHISWCNAAWTDDLIARKCHSYTSYVYNTDGQAFKNIYCAKCNFVNINELICVAPNNLNSYADKYNDDLLKDLYARGEHMTCTVGNYYSGNRISSECGPGLMPFSIGSDTTCITIPEFPFTTLNFNNFGMPREVCSLEFLIPITSKNRLSRRYCKSGYVFDPFLGRCRTLSLQLVEASGSIIIVDDQSEINDDYSGSDIKEEIPLINAQERSSNV